MSKLNELSDQDFAGLYQQFGPAELVRRLGCAERTLYSRRTAVEARLGIKLAGPHHSGAHGTSPIDDLKPESPVISVDLRDGVVLVGGDGHYWPGVHSTAHRAFVHYAKALAPKIVVFNGDALDGASISRHPPIGWEHAPTLEDELTEVQTRLGELQQAAGKKARYIWPLGNHDARFNTRLAAMTPEFRNVHGTRLTHHFPEWEPCWALAINGERGAVVKHSFKGGTHATHANAMWSGRTMVTNHLHSLKVTPFTDYNGTRWGVDCGCLACPVGPQFNYGQRNPVNHRSGFAVLTWRNGVLLWPELVTVHDEGKGIVNFRGELVNV